MKVMTFNVLCGGCEGHSWQDRKDEVIATVRNHMPDIFGIQEAHLNWMKIFREGLPEYDYVGVGRDDGKEGGEFSPVFYRRDKYELLDKGWFWISETPDVPSRSWETACPRICSWAKLKCISCGKTFIAMNVHLDHVSALARKNGVRLINEFAKKFDCPAFITGDFNIPQNEDCYVDMANGGVFKDVKFLAPETENKPTFHSFFHHDCAPGIIDFVFITEGIEAQKYMVCEDKFDGHYPSDHCPVLVEIKVK